MRLLRLITSQRGRRLLALLTGASCAAALAASATTQRAYASSSAYVPSRLLAAARANPQHTFRVILQGAGVRGEANAVAAVRASGASVARELRTISGASAAVTGKQLVRLAGTKGVAAITVDQAVRLTDNGDDDTGSFSSTQQWPYAVKAQRGWAKAKKGKLPAPPAIAIVDSGIQADRPDFDNGANVLTQVTMVNTGTPNAAGDGYGHGTFVAGIADGAAQGYTGTAPTVPLVSIDVLDDQGMGLTSDVIAACDWIGQNKAKYNIEVANFSLQSSAPASLFWDPLDKAVEKLWFDGVTVVASAGNYGTGNTPSGVLYAPANDPFVITVGADDISGTVGAHNDTAAPWSAWGYTYDGFAKPEISAPGRSMVGPVPDNSTLATSRPDDMVAPGYEELSGTSFAAPVVAGTAAYLLALNPKWKPDQVKGAIMLSAKAEPNATPGSVGVGLVDVATAGQVGGPPVGPPPNPNAALDKFVHPVPGAGPIPLFDSAAWQAAALKNPNWDNPTWNAAAWGSAAWGSAAWGSSTLAQQLASSNAAWGSAAWGSVATADVAADGP